MAEQALEANRVISVQSTPPASEFQASVSAALDAFAEGRLAKVVLSRKLTLTLHQPADPQQVMARLMAQNPHAFHFSLPLGQGRRLLGASPELLLRVSGERCSPIHWRAPPDGRASRRKMKWWPGICWPLARISMSIVW